MNLQHNFKTKAHDLEALFIDTHLMSTFMRKLEQQALIDPIRYESQKYLGDGFEFFIELFLKLHPTDNRIGVYDYKPIQENDNGVDGIGLNIRNEKCVVQIKYRSNTKTLLTANEDHLSNMITDGMLAHNVVADISDKKNFRHFVFTTANGLHFYTDNEMFKSKVKCVNYKDLRNMLDNNLPFWSKSLEIIQSLPK